MGDEWLLPHGRIVVVEGPLVLLLMITRLVMMIHHDTMMRGLVGER